ncbi:MAG: hypothetical protein KAG61_09625 [Bacteriovoracaceae bacterium]|nr:hypothetical protein [Bacteriovoracaceae bacterium]
MKKSLITLSILATAGSFYLTSQSTDDVDGRTAATSTLPKAKSIKVESSLGEIYLADLEERFAQKYSAERISEGVSSQAFEVRERIYLLKELIVDSSVDYFQLMELGSFAIKVIHNGSEYNLVKREAARVLIKVSGLMAPSARQAILNAIGPRLLFLAQNPDCGATLKFLGNS